VISDQRSACLPARQAISDQRSATFFPKEMSLIADREIKIFIAICVKPSNRRSPIADR
jgi:hypothetical protein